MWWDRRLFAGEDIHDVIAQQLRAAKTVIVLWSPHSTASHWVRGEAQLALDANKLVPIKIAECELPINFLPFNTPEVFKSKGQLDELSKLVGLKLREHGLEPNDKFIRSGFDAKSKEMFHDQLGTIHTSFMDQQEADTWKETLAKGKRLDSQIEIFLKKYPVTGRVVFLISSLVGLITAAVPLLILAFVAALVGDETLRTYTAPLEGFEILIGIVLAVVCFAFFYKGFRSTLGLITRTSRGISNILFRNR
ncbi:MAG: hypothetical protein RLZ98_2825 [Pseudomonadota bacterium]